MRSPEIPITLLLCIWAPAESHSTWGNCFMRESGYYLSTNEKQSTATHPGAWMSITEGLAINICNVLYKCPLSKSEDQNWSEPLLLFKQRHFRRYWLYLDKMITRIKTSFVYFNRGYCRFMFTENVSGVCGLSSDVYFQWQFPCLPQPQCTYNRVKKKNGTLLGDERNAVLLLGGKPWIVGHCARERESVLEQLWVLTLWT